MKAVKRKTGPQTPHKENNGWDEANETDGLDVENQDDHFIYSHNGLTSDEALSILMKIGKNELPEKKVSKLYIFFSLLWEPMPIMIWIAIIIEAFISKWMDMAVLLGIQITNTSIAFYETTKAGDAIAALKSSLKPEATVKRDGKWKPMDASLLAPGDLVLLATGSAVPADCRINEGQIDVDQSSLTGEALPVTMYKGDSCKMGSNVVRGEVEGTVEFTGADTFFGRTAQMLQGDNEPSNLQLMLMDIMIALVVVSLTLCAVVYLHLVHITSVVEALSFTVILVVASIPLAIEIVTTTTLALGSKELSHHGAIVTRLSAIEDLAGMSILCSDKTGTLTLNKMVIQDEAPLYVDNTVIPPHQAKATLLQLAALATKWKEPPKDALDTMVLRAVEMSGLDRYELIEHLPFDPIVKRTESTVRDRYSTSTSDNNSSSSSVSMNDSINNDSYSDFSIINNATSSSSVATSNSSNINRNSINNNINNNNSSGGHVFKTTKGAPQIILKLVNDPAVAAAVERDVQALGERGIRSLAIARTYSSNSSENSAASNHPFSNTMNGHTISNKHSNTSSSSSSSSSSNSATGERWVLMGLLTFLDPPRPDTLQTLDEAQRYGVAVKMITGDHQLIAKETAKRLNLGYNILAAHGLPSLDPVTRLKPMNLARNYGKLILNADGFAEVFPEHKYLIVECLRELGYKVGMTGDGVNDAPALKRADVGVAVSGSTDAARAAADIVLTEPGLVTIIHGILIARCIFARMRNFITYRIAATLQLLFFFFIAIFAYRPVDYEPEDQDDNYWPHFFHMPVIMLMLITLLNDGTLIAIGYDHVEPSHTPTLWNLKVLFTIGIVLAGVACISSLLLLQLSLNSWRENSLYQRIGLGGISYGQITTSIFLKVAVSDFLTLFSARAGESWFWTSRPAPILLAAAGLALGTSTLVACFWPRSKPDGIPTMGLLRQEPRLLPLFIWLYCIIWWFIQDAAKVYTFYLLKKYNVFGYNDTGMIIDPESPRTSPYSSPRNSINGGSGGGVHTHAHLSHSHTHTTRPPPVGFMGGSSGSSSSGAGESIDCSGLVAAVNSFATKSLPRPNLNTSSSMSGVGGGSSNHSHSTSSSTHTQPPHHSSWLLPPPIQTNWKKGE